MSLRLLAGIAALGEEALAPSHDRLAGPLGVAELLGRSTGHTLVIVRLARRPPTS